MLVIDSRNVDGVRIRHEFNSPMSFVANCRSENPDMGDNEILLVTLYNQVLYSSLGHKAKSYDDTLRTADLYAWFN